MRKFLSCSVLILLGSAAQAQWSPLKVDVWDPAFNKDRKHHAETYSALDKASRNAGRSSG